MPDSERIEAFYARDKPWIAELRALRAILLDCGLTEELKWHQPCYTAHGGNVAMPAGLKTHCWLSFFKGVLLSDPEGVLEAPGEHSRSARMIRFHSLDEVAAREDVIRACLAEAVANEKAGRRVAFPKDDLDVPEELTEALEADPELADAFAALTPGRRRSYYMHVGKAKQPATRVARIVKCRPFIMAGKNFQGR